MTRKFSRHMPKRNRIGWAHLIAIATLLLAPPLVWGPVGLVPHMIMLLLYLDSRRYCRKKAAKRPGESICQFVRSFEQRSIDPWILRGVYEEFSHGYPIRKSDHFEKDLGFDPEDIDFAYWRIAKRAARGTENTDQNPLFGRVQTVGDLVHFLQQQPRLSG